MPLFWPETFVYTVLRVCELKWLKYNSNINKTSIFGIHLYFLYFFNVNDDQAHFSTVE